MSTLAEQFAAFDIDGSGTLTAEEVLTILTRPSAGQALTPEDAQAFIDLCAAHSHMSSPLRVPTLLIIVATPTQV